MLHPPTSASPQLEPPTTPTVEYLLVPSRRRGCRYAQAAPLWAVAAPTEYGWSDERAWDHYSFTRDVESVFAFGAALTLRSVRIGNLAAVRGPVHEMRLGATATKESESWGGLSGEGWMNEHDGVTHLELYVEDPARARRALRDATQRGGALRLQVTERREGGGRSASSPDIVFRLDPVPFTGLRDASTRAHHRLRSELQALALRLAASGNTDFPPLLKPQDWKRSEVHKAAREITLQLGDATYRRGWTAERLKIRIYEALEFLLAARAGGLGAPYIRNRDHNDGRSPKRTVLVADGLPEELVSQGMDPVRDPRTSLAYAVSLSSGVAGRLLGDEPAENCLREVPNLVAQYLAMRWLRYDPLSTAFARALVTKEATLFTDRVLREPTGLLDGSLSFGTDSLAYRLSDSGRRTTVLAGVRLAQHGVKRLLSTAALLAVLLFLEVPHAGWIAAAWLFLARRIVILLFGLPEPSQAEQRQKLSQQMFETLGALTDREVPIAVFRHALLTASEQGVAWDAAAWRLLADAEGRGAVVWRSSPDPLCQ